MTRRKTASQGASTVPTALRQGREDAEGGEAPRFSSVSSKNLSPEAAQGHRQAATKELSARITA